MTTAAPATRATLPAWQGWIRAGSGYPSEVSGGSSGRLELGAAVFSLPEPGEAKTTSWARVGGRFCAFTGFLYNRRDLAGELGLEAESFPAEVALAGYVRWGFDVLGRMEGPFACAVWDQPAETLLCGRDIIGMHPFFYCVAGEDLIFSWDLETVLGHPRVSRELDPVTLAEHLTHHLYDANETFFRAVRRLPAGHGLKQVRGRREVFRYWDPAPAGKPMRWATAEEARELPRLLRRACERVMECVNGRTGILLSGGLDSVSVAAYASDLAAERGWPRPRAFSVVFPGEGDEESVQKDVAEKLGLPQTLTTIRDFEKGPGLLQRALDVAAVCPAPPAFVFAPPFLHLLGEAKTQGCDVLLTGDGGDELLLATPAWAADLIRAGDWVQVARLLKTLIRFWKGPIAGGFRTVLWSYGLRPLLRDWAWKKAPGLAMRRRRELHAKAFPAWVAPDPRLRRQLESRYEERCERQIGEDSFYLAHLNMFLLYPGTHMVFEEQFYRNSPIGVATLHPYWHRPVADLLLRTPPQVLTSGSQSKSLIRPVLARRFPRLGFEKQKKVVSDDYAREVMRRELPGVWRDLGAAGRLREFGLVDAGRYGDMLSRRIQSEKGSDLYQAWHGASVETWIRCQM